MRPPLRHLRIFISSPGDVGDERRRAALVVRRLRREFTRFFEVEPVLWEYEVMLAQGHFQDAILPPSSSDVFVCILWSRLGTPLPTDRYRGSDGRIPVTGTEWEFENALTASRASGTPDLLVYRKDRKATVEFDREAEALSAARQRDALDEFWRRYFQNAEGEFLAGFHTFAGLDDFETMLEAHLRSLLRRRATDPERTATPDRAISWYEGSPFRGLQAFEETHAGIFFGREEAQKQVVEQLVRRAESGVPFVLVLGTSGVGKSSLVSAGVLPDLMEPGVVGGVDFWRRLVVRPRDVGRDLFTGFAEALLRRRDALPELKAAGTSVAEAARLLRDDPDAFLALLRNTLQAATTSEGARFAKPSAEGRLVLVVDQLEELFTLDAISKDERRRFATSLAALARGPVWVVATMRSDFYHRLAELPDLVELLRADGRTTGEHHLLPPRSAEVEQMIRLPAAAAGIAYEVDPERGIGLDAELRQALEGNAGALPLLEFVLDELYRRDVEEAGASTLTFASYRFLGGLEGAIAQRAETVCARLPQDAVAAVLRAVVTVREEDDAITARTVRRDLVGTTGDRARVIDELIAARLLLAEGDADSHSVRMVHEALVTHWPRLLDLIASDRGFLRTRARLARLTADWLADARRGDRLLQDGIPLGEGAQALEQRHDDLDPDTVAFVEASIAAAARRRDATAREARKRIRRARQVAAVVGALAAVAVGLAFLTVRGQRRELAAQQQAINEGERARRALAKSDFDEGRRLSDSGHGDLAVAYLARATRLGPDDFFASSYLAALLEQRGFIAPVAVLPPVGATTTARIGRTGKLAVLGLQSGAVEMWNLDEGRRIAVLPLDDALRDAAIDPSEGFVVTADQSGKFRTWDASGGSSIAERSDLASVSMLALSADGHRLLAASSLEARVYDARTLAPLSPVLRLPHAVTSSVALGGNGDAVFLGTYDGRIVQFDLSGKTKQQERAAGEHDAIQLAASPDGTAVAAAWSRNVVRVFAGGRKTRLEGPAELRIADLTLSTRGSVVAAKGYSGDVWTWILMGDAVVHGRQLVKSDAATVALDAWGERIAVADEAGVVHVRSTRDRTAIFGLPFRHGDQILAIAFVGDGGRVAAASADGGLRVSDVRVRAVTNASIPLTHTIATGRLLHDGKVLLLSATGTATLVEPGSTSPPIVNILDLGGARDAVLSADGETIAAGADDGEIRTFRTRDGSRLGPPAPDRLGSGIDALAISGDGTSVAAGLRNGDIVVLDPTGARPTQRLKVAGPGMLITHVALDDAGDRLGVVWGAPWTLNVFDLERDAAAASLPFSAAMPRALEFLDGTQALYGTSYRGHEVTVWSPDGAEWRRCSVKGGREIAGAFAHAGDLFVAALTPPGWQAWKTAECRPITPIVAESQDVKHMSLSADGSRLTTIDLGGVELWDVATQTPRLPRIAEPSLILAAKSWVGLSANADRIFFAGGPRFWEIDVPDCRGVDRELLARLGESAVGHRLTDDAGLVAIERPDLEYRAAAEAIRDAAPTTSCSALLRWMVDDPWHRTVSPSSAETVDDHLQRILASFDINAGMAIESRFVDHPLVARGAWRAQLRQLPR